MLIRSKAPLRIGLAGGGTDVSPYSEIYGGAVLNATVNMYAYATIRTRDDGRIILHAADKDEKYEFNKTDRLPLNGDLNILKGIYNRVVKDFTHEPLSFELSTFVDAPPGSGLGTSSTLVVAILGAFAEWLNLPLGEYDMAQLAYDIERVDLQMAGGKQDQYAATFGGVNYMEFNRDGKVVVNPLPVRRKYLNELAYNLVLFYTETSRLSSEIIETQVRNVINNDLESVEAMHRLKEQSVMMKEALLMGQLDKVGEILDFGWKNKKKMARGITNPFLEEIYKTAKDTGASGGKISGAGGGGFMIFYCPDNARLHVVEALKKYGGEVKRYEFVQEGVTTWSL